jgi:hypothetical protein
MYRDEELRRAIGAEEYRLQSQRIREEREALKKAERRELRQGIATAIAYVMVVVWIVAVSALDAAPFGAGLALLISKVYLAVYAAARCALRW